MAGIHRFSRIEQMIGAQGLECLKGKTVTLVGLGAVGGYALEGLSRSGIGALRLVDFDRVEISNFNRQILAVENNLGKLKSDCALERVQQINPDCRVVAFPVFLDKNNLAEFLAEPGDLVIDAIDSLEAKADLLEFCWKRGIPVLSSMGAARKRNPLGLCRADLMDTQVCPLAKKLRLELKKRGVDRGISVIYSREKPSDLAPPVQPVKGERAPLGSFPAVTAMFGLNLSQWALEILLGDSIGS